VFERFTDRARRALVFAQDEAREMGHGKIDPDHLLVALARGEGLAATAMAEAGVDTDALRRRVALAHPHEPAAGRLDKVPFSRAAKKSLELSLRAALKLGHNYIGTEHLFLGLQREREQRGETLDGLLGVATAEVHDRLLQGLRSPEARAQVRSPALHAALRSAARAAGGTPMTTGHLLVALAADVDSQAARALARLGVGAQELRSAVEAVPVTETSDALPAPAALRITAGDKTRLVTDADVVAAVEAMSTEELRAALRRAILPTTGEQATG